MKYYHITPTRNKLSIMSSGLKSNDKHEIFVFTDPIQSIFIATNQLGIAQFTMFEISSKGITGTIESDNVADFGSVNQLIIKQGLIEAKYIEHLHDIDANMLDMINTTEELKLKKMGYNKAEIIDTMRLYPERTNRYNIVHGTNYTVLSIDEFNRKYSA
ncbi:hypothetical protein [Hyunsoonleella rubra]|uniref:Uncharacterized protein n=1 Tax=Hyunsoonleella rubra TaxID=1737062 RepID=A0ABW5TBQ3_9FLAO